ncbi:hypothetical protein Tco_0822354 [Tanacetum coccineum]|uniref:PB1-like domain-containing protein n=1 Tax=Tanacetum coccineum TaxID=301880 RepID=A0ABQ5AEX3_9ASTR
MVLVDHTGWKLRHRQWTGTTEQLIEQLELTYDNAPNMFSIRIHHGGKFQRYPGRMYVSGRVDIFDMVDIDLFTVVALNMMVLKLGYTGKSEPMFYNYLKPLTSLDEGLYALACEEDVRCLGTLVRSFKLIEVYIEHGVTALDSYLRAPRFRATLEEITDEAGSIAANRNEKMLLLTWHESSETTKEPVCESVTPSSLPQHDSSTPCKDSVCFADVAGGGVDSLGLSDDESFGVDDMDLNLNEPLNLNVSQVETQSKLPVSREPDVGIDTAYETEYDVQYSEDAGTDDDDDDVDEDFLVDEENEIVEPDVDVNLFGISMDLPFDNIGITNLVPDDVLEGEDMDVINADGFDSDPGNDEEKNCRKRRLAELRNEIEEAQDRVYLHSIENKRNLKLYRNNGVWIRARCDGKVHVFTMSQCTGLTGPNRGMEAGLSRSSGPTTSSKKGRIQEKTNSQTIGWINSDIPLKAVQDQLQHELEVQISMSKTFRAKAKAEREIKGDRVLQYSMLTDYVVELHSTNPNTTVKIAVERNTDPSLPTRVFQRIYICLGALKLGFRGCRRDMLGLDGAFMKGSFPGQVLVTVGLDSNNEIYPLAYALVEAENMPSEVVEQRMDANVPDEIDGAKGEQVPNHVVKKGNLEFLVCKEVANPGVNELVDKGRPLKRERVYAE